MVVIDENEYLAHYGILRRSGRYPWGSGGNAKTLDEVDFDGFMRTVNELKAQGLTEVQIAQGFGISTTELRAAKSIARNRIRQNQITEAFRLKEKGYSNVAGAAKMGVPESTFRNLIAPGMQDKKDTLQATADMLKQHLEGDKPYLDVGTGVENYLNVSATKLSTAVAILREEGYEVFYVKEKQLGTGKDTTIKVLAPPGTKYTDVSQNRENIGTIKQLTDDGGRNWYGLQDPISVSSKRIDVRYAEDGGGDADGVIYVRPGVKDLSLGNARYAQVRIAVDGTHYLKGMAMYKDDLPEGVDLLFNTNKSDTGKKHDAFKKMTDDPDNPFGAIVNQIGDRDAQGRLTKVTSAMNIVNEEGDWGGWSKSISAQMLSKQSPSLAKAQLDIAYQNKKAEFDEIMGLTNPTVRRKLLEEFASNTDASAVHLKAAALPRQQWQVILPIENMSPGEIYAPNFKDGERVALIRYPHGGTFEIPDLVVNNRQRTAKKLLGQARDAVGIHPKVAERLSGADFDGDTVLVIPNNKKLIRHDPALEGLKGFDPKASYPGYPGMKKITGPGKQREMGDVSNLITDMTIKGASTDEIARAVRHSMVVIDAEKHGLDWRKSAQDNGIRALKEKYQGSPRGGAATLISNSGQNARVAVDKRKPRPYSEGGPIDKVTGKRMYVPTGERYVNKKGHTVVKKDRVPKLDLVDDVGVYSSGTPMERVYVDHANRLKKLGNQARLAMVRTPSLVYSPSASRAYKRQVDSLNAKLDLAVRHRPLERQAQLIANQIVKAKLADNPTMTSELRKKIESQALHEARNRVGGPKPKIEITPDEWNAIQAGAISNSKLNAILANVDIDQVKKYAMPKPKLLMSPAKLNRAQQMLDGGYTREEIASALGVSVGTLDDSLYGEG